MNLCANARALQLLFVGCVSLFAQEIPAPPPAPPVITGEPATRFTLTAIAAAAPTLFSIGDPTDEEQMYLELINRARADAVAEANRLLAVDDIYIQTALEKVDTNLMKAQFATNPPTAPLSFHAKLMKAARDHTKHQFDIGEQTHFGPGPTDGLAKRLQTVAYPFATAAENVYVYAQNPEHGHAGFEVDWSGGPKTENGGMQFPSGHRDNIHNASFNEIGIGVLNGTNQVGSNFEVGPQLLTQDFGRSSPALIYVTGVAYYDLNGNSFYDVGEGLSGVTVIVDGASSYAVTAQSGGYSVPVSSGQTHTVRFKAAGVADTVMSANVSDTSNVKVDYKPVFTLSALTSKPGTVFAGTPNLISFSSLGGASGYQVRLFSLVTPPVEGAEGLLANVTITTTGNYPSVSTESAASGAKSFHLGHMADNFGFAYPQIVQLKNPFYVKAGARVDFMSRLGIAFAGIAATETEPATGPGEVARLEISTDEGKTWTTIWSQPGKLRNGDIDTSEGIFFARSASLADYVGKFVMLRFNFDVDTSVGWFELPPPGDPDHKRYGWYVDDIAITGADMAANPTFITLDSSATFPFTPPTPGGYLMQFAAVAGTRVFPAGPFAEVIAVQGTPPVYSMSNASVASGVVSMRVSKVSGTIGPIALYSAPSVLGPWTRETGATITGPTGNDYLVSAAVNGAIRFYRAAAN